MHLYMSQKYKEESQAKPQKHWDQELHSNRTSTSRNPMNCIVFIFSIPILKSVRKFSSLITLAFKLQEFYWSSYAC